MNTAELISAHHTDQLRRGLMVSSITQRDTKLGIFGRYIDPIGLLEVSAEDIQLFLDGRRARDGGAIGSKTRYAWLSHLHGFYEWARREELIPVSPTAKIIRPKLRSGLPRPAATDELKHALAVATPQERCWVLLAALMGLRCQEIAGMRREDVLDGEGLLRVVKAKGGKERTLPLHPDVLEALRAMPMPRTGRVFSRPRGGAYSPAQFSQNFNAFLKRACGESAPTAHQLRHWFGTNLYAQSQDIRMTQEMLGHASPATTAIYTAFDRRAAAAAIGNMTLNGPEAA